MTEVLVPLGDRSYRVLVGAGTVDAVASVLPPGASRAVVVTQAGVPLREALLGALSSAGLITDVVEIGGGEHDKTLATIEMLCRRFADIGLTRRDVVIGLGGGLVTDVAGFAASVWHRGIPVVQVATSLLAMVDAAIGGKTGVNLPEGKNLVGAFWQPSGVICDLDALATLPEREQRCGRGEMAKYHFITGDDLLNADLETRIARCVEIKAEVVAADEREGGRRALLNYGHTLAHALEITSGHELAHGEAVAIGLAYAARLGYRLGRIDADRVALHDRVVVEEYGLDIALASDHDPEELVALMGRDKKALGGLTFVLDGPRGLEVVEGVDPLMVREALVAMPQS